MAKAVVLSEKAIKLRSLFPENPSLETWYQLPAGFEGMIAANGSVYLRRKVKLQPDGSHHVWRIDKVTASGKEKFIGYHPMNDLESQLY